MKFTFALALVFILSGCIQGMGGKVSPQQESAMGAQQERQVLRKMKTIKSGKYYRAVNSVGRHIAAVSNRPNFQWKYHLVNNPKQANAFVLPGGKVFVYTGLFKYAANKSELAAVIGHEVAHALKSHGVKGAQRKQNAGLLGVALQIGMGVAGVNGQTAQQVNQIYGQGASIGYIKPYSRKHESQADAIGLMLMAKAGYDPRAALSFWKKFAKSGQRVPEYLSTHPAPQSRIAQIKKLMPKALALYKKSRYKRK